MKRFLLFVVLLYITLLSGCGSKIDSKNDSSDSGYTKITADEANLMIEKNSDIIILDVRSEEEYNMGHIKDAILIPDTEILEDAEESLPDKASTILVYCRSGRRSALAASDLVEMGYSNIYDFGGINDWEYEIVTD